MNVQSFRRMPVISLVSLVLAVSGSCSKNTYVPEGGTELESECTDPLTTSFRAGQEVVAESDIEGYEAVIRPGALDVGLLDGADAELATLETTFDMDLSPQSGLLREWRAVTRHVDESDVDAEQTVRARPIDGSRTWLEIANRSGDVTLTQWAVVDDSFEPLYQAIGVEVVAGDGGTRLVDGRQFEMLEIADETGSLVATDKVAEWLQEHVGTAFEEPAWRRLIYVGADPALYQGLDARVRQCDAASTAATEESLIDRRQAVCPYESRGQALCQNGSILGGGLDLSVSAVAGTVGIALVLTATAVVGTRVATLGMTGRVAKAVVGVPVGEAVGRNSDAVFDGLFTAAGASLGDQEAGSAAAEFFKSGDGGSSGDPHLDTFDGLTYSFHGAGEYVLTRAVTGEDFEVQVRQEPLDGLCSSVAVNTAAATRVGDTRVAFYAGDEPLWIDGAPAQIETIGAFEDGGTIEQERNLFVIRRPSGDRLGVRVFDDRVDIVVSPAANRTGELVGLLGDFDGSRTNDMRPAGANALPLPVGWREVRDVFGHSWRVSAAESLFDYDDGETPDDFVDAAFPDRPTTIDDLPADARRDAEGTCATVEDEVAFVGCVIDVACTGDSSFVDSHVTRNPGEAVVLRTPVFLDDWTQEGDLTNGVWEFEPSGDGVQQVDNGDPTFLVGPTDFRDVTLTGVIRVDDPYDDDVVGFVFGYQSPLSSQADDVSVFDTFVLSWKARGQSDSAAGFVLSHLSGAVPSVDYTPIFWERQQTDVQQILGRDEGEGRGWASKVSYPFELTYTADEIVIIVGGEEIFRIAAADSPVAFEPGRFGFYNYSQALVVYSDFAVAAAGDSSESLEGLEVGVDYPGNTLTTMDVSIGDPRACREACTNDVRCAGFVYERPKFGEDPAQCELKTALVGPVAREGVISGSR